MMCHCGSRLAELKQLAEVHKCSAHFACALRAAWTVRNTRNENWAVASCRRRYGTPYLLGLLAMIKCSICSYQCDN